MNTVEELYATLQRYAGWLGKDHFAKTVKSDVKQLGDALDSGVDLRGILSDLQTNVDRLGDGELKDLLASAVAQLRQTVRR
jgi:hypothetical protein